MPSPGDEFLVQLLPRPKARERDGDVLVRLETVEPDEIPGHVDDADGFAHVEDEDLSALTHGPACRMSWAASGNAHEVAAHIGMRHRHRSARRNLLLEQGDDRPGAAEDVSEADGHEPGHLLSVHALHEEFGDPLGSPHDVGGPNGLVRRHQHEPLRIRLHGQLDEIARAQDVVQNRLAGVAFLHGHVLVGRGVEDDLGPEARQDPVQRLAVADVRQEALRRQCLEPESEFLLDLEQVELAEIEKPHDLGLEPADLAHEFRADGAAGAGYKDPLTAEKAADHLWIEMDFLAAHEILQPHLADGIDGDAPLDELADLGDRAVPLAGPVAQLHDAAHHIARADGMAIRISSNWMGSVPISSMAPRTGTP
jgi:hypothetical protein